MWSRFEGFQRSRTHQSGWRIEPNVKLYHRVLAKSIPGGVGQCPKSVSAFLEQTKVSMEIQ
jgi:hypothetical protein